MAGHARSIRAAEARFGWRLIAPSAAVIALLILYPIGYNVFLSFFDVRLQGANVYVGARNYTGVLADPAFWRSAVTTVVYVAGTTAGTTLVGLGVALVMNKRFPLRGLARSLILLPYVAPVIAVVYGWQFIFDPVNGVFMHVTVELLGLFEERFNLIGAPRNAIVVAILFNVWKNFPFSYLMLLSSLQAIDDSLYEAAQIDGASGWQRFRFITLPEIFFVLGALVILRVIWNFNKFEEVFLLTDNVRVLSVFTYFKAFTGALDQGQGAALAVIQFLLLVGFILFYVKRVLKW